MESNNKNIDNFYSEKLNKKLNFNMNKYYLNNNINDEMNMNIHSNNNELHVRQTRARSHGVKRVQFIIPEYIPNPLHPLCITGCGKRIRSGIIDKTGLPRRTYAKTCFKNSENK